MQLLQNSGALEATALLLVRANDWVQAVQLQAHAALWKRLVPECREHWIELFPLVVRLLEGTRAGAPEWFSALLKLLSQPESRQLLQSKFAFLDDLTRKSLMQVVQHQLTDPGWLPILQKDPSIQVRRLLAQHAPVADLFELTGDADFKVREKVTQRIAQEGTPQQIRPVLLQALLDMRSGNRALAQYLLKKQGDEVRRLYLAMQPNNTREKIGLAGGLADVGTLQDLPLLKNLSRHPHPRVRAEALRGLGRLGPVQFQKELEDAVLEVQRISWTALYALRAAQLIAEPAIQRLWLKATTPRQRKNLIQMVLQLPRYQAVAVLLEWRPLVTPEEGGKILQHIQILLKGYGVAYFTKPAVSIQKRIWNSLYVQEVPRTLKATLLELSNH
ncbi:HEAT repeat domain-containing protein [Deinococcus roseus]|uniref:HEAT repeat domain-containing protein n=1 Tax=Deinococcus roseus TaxID=392414 RepID=UPI00166B3B4C|nr:hypothetical protein [Deinococcus roseus]